jgi:hypothetical protein
VLSSGRNTRGCRRSATRPSRKAEIDQELDAIESELAAIAAYEQAKGGKPREPRSGPQASAPLPREQGEVRGAKRWWI